MELTFLGAAGAVTGSCYLLRVGARNILLEYGQIQGTRGAEQANRLREVFAQAERHKGNVLIPAFAVGRTQDLLYLFGAHFEAWNIGAWRVFLDSPTAIQASDVYSQFRHLYGAKLFRQREDRPQLSNLVATRTSEESMAINRIESGAGPKPDSAIRRRAEPARASDHDREPIDPRVRCNSKPCMFRPRRAGLG